MTIYRIQNIIDTSLFWSNENGWGDQDVANLFSHVEKAELPLPSGGMWREIENAPPSRETRLADLLREARTMIDDLNKGYPSKELHRTPEDLIAAIDERLGE